MSPRYGSNSAKADPSPLAQPLHFEFANKTAPNRFLKAAMTERLSSWSPTDLPARGIPSKALINVYKRWGEGEPGVILIGNTMMEFDQLEAAGNPIIPRKGLTGSEFSGPRFEAFKEMASASKEHGSLVLCQVSHPGRQVENRIQKDPVSASDVQLEGNVMGMEFNKPHAATKEEIKKIVDGWAHAAEYLDKAGYDGIELHSAHGYLLAQFISQTTNKRTDEYGGSLENRARIIVEIAQEIQKRVKPGFILGIKLNSVEFQEKGFQPEEAKELVKILEGNNFDFVELSGGTYENLAFQHKRESTKKREAFFMDFADMIVPALSKTKTYVTGGFRSLEAMVDAMETIQGIGLARPICQEPDIAKKIISGEISGAIEQKFDQTDFGLTNVVAGSQIRQVGKDQEPFDGSKEANVEAFMKDMAKWGEQIGQDKAMEKYGYVDVANIPASPYHKVAA